MSLGSALERVSAERAAALTLGLVRIPSPTGDTAAVSERFAAELASLGMEVERFDAFPATPVIIGRLRGAGDGPTLILNGHLDTVPVPHPEPEWRKGEGVYGRGATDMKGPLAAAVEAVRAAGDAGLRFRGDVVICAHGLHEAPGGHGEDLTAALHQGAVRGDAAVVLEIGHDALPVAGLGCAIFRAAFRRPGSVTHELMTPAGTPNPAYAAAEAAGVLQQFAAGLQERQVERIGAETLFLGQMHCGDFYNRFPVEAWLEGTRRWAPESSAEAAGAELRALLEPVAARHGVELDFRFEKIRDGFRISEGHPLVGALRTAYQDETRRELPLTGIRIVADAPLFEKEGGISCVYHGLESHGAHGDLEWVTEAELERGARVYVRLMAGYLGLDG